MSETADLRNRIRAMQDQVGLLRRPLSDDERTEIAQATERAAAAYREFGWTPSQPVPGESPICYRRRILQPMLEHSQSYAKATLDGVQAAALAGIERTVLDEAVQKARSPSSHAPMTLVPVKERDVSGREITRFNGDNMAWMQYFMTPGRVGKFVEPPARKR